MDIYQSANFICNRILDHTTYSGFFVFLQKNLSPDYLNCWSLNWNFERTKKIKSFITKRVTFKLSYRCVWVFLAKESGFPVVIMTLVPVEPKKKVTNYWNFPLLYQFVYWYTTNIFILGTTATHVLSHFLIMALIK